MHRETLQEVLVEVEDDSADLQRPFAHHPPELDPGQLEVLVPDGLHLSVGVQAGLELQDGLELLVRVEVDLDDAVDVVQAVPVL